MQAIVDTVVGSIFEILVLVIGSLLSVALVHLKKHLQVLRKKDELGIVDVITDRVVELVEAEYKGANGVDKLNKAIKLTSDILDSKGINVSVDVIRAGIENGVNKLPKELKVLNLADGISNTISK
jgi:hypothetical protein